MKTMLNSISLIEKENYTFIIKTYELLLKS